jgi:hypothetical protein
MEGAVALESGQGATLALLEAPATVMLASVVLDVPALVTAWAAPRSEVLLIPGEALRQAARTDAALAFAVSEELSGCYSGVVRALKEPASAWHVGASGQLPVDPPPPPGRRDQPDAAQPQARIGLATGHDAREPVRAASPAWPRWASRLMARP